MYGGTQRIHGRYSSFMRKIVFLFVFSICASTAFACSCTKGFIGKYFLHNIRSFDAIVMVEATADPLVLEHNLTVIKVYKGVVEESEMLRLSGGFCSDLILAKRGTRYILGLYNLDGEEKAFELSTCLTSKITISDQRVNVGEQFSAWGGKARIGLFKRQMKLTRLESRINSKV